MTTVLVVDDEFDIRELLVDTLLDAGLEVIEASDGRSALERIATDHPDIVLLDIWMPCMDGLEVLGKLREDPATEELPVILLTAMPATVGESAGLKMGVTHYLNKPWEPGVVEATLRVALREASKTAKTQSSEAGESDETDLGSASLNISADEAKQFMSQGAMAKLKSGRKKKPTITNKEGDEVEVITTGEKLPALDEKMGGGLPIGTLNVAVGAAAAGKSVICQHLAWGALEGGYGVAFFTSEFSSSELATQMASIGLDVTKYLRTNKLTVYPVPEPTEGEEAAPVLNSLSQAIERLSRGAEFIVVDSITDLAGSCPEQAVIAFFSACRRLGNNGRTILVSVHSYAFGSEMFMRLRTLCDGFFTLGSEQVRGKSMRILQVNKMNTTELSGNNSVAFVVEPETGARLIPFNKT
ncbi:MAG: response regulator [Chloroflexi bacterium]|nr:response regulator [Chloroflexota bacterium]